VVAGSRIVASRLAERFRGNVPSIPLEVIYVRPDLREHVGVRVAKAINQALRTLDLPAFDYLLKVDADVLMKTDYLEKCVSLGADLVGLGPFMLVRVKPFLLLLRGKWPETPADDAYVMMAFKARGLRVAPCPPDLLVRRKGGARGSWRYYYLRGVDDWRVGFDPIRELFAVLWLIIRRRSMLPLFTLLGYLVALARGERMYEFGSTNLVSGLRHHVNVVKRLTRRRD